MACGRWERTVRGFGSLIYVQAVRSLNAFRGALAAKSLNAEVFQTLTLA